MEDNIDSNQLLSQYVLAVKEIKNAIIDSRYRVARQVNKEVLSLYYWVGNYVSVNSRIGNRQTSSADLNDDDWDCFLSVGFSNHREIIRKTSTLEERLFYIRRCATEFWSVETTKYHLKENLYHKEGGIQQTNFEKTLIDSNFKQRALQSFKYVKLPDENPSIGIILCKSKNEEIAVKKYHRHLEIPQFLAPIKTPDTIQ